MNPTRIPILATLLLSTLGASFAFAAPMSVRIQCAFDQPPVTGTIEIPSPASFYLSYDAPNSFNGSSCFQFLSKDELSVTINGMKYVARGDYDVNLGYNLCTDNDGGKIAKFKQIGLAAFNSDPTLQYPSIELTNGNNFELLLAFQIVKGRFVALSFSTEKNGVHEDCSLAY